MILFHLIYCFVIIVFIAIIVYAYKKYKKPVIDIINNIKTIYIVLSKFTKDFDYSIKDVNYNINKVGYKYNDIVYKIDAVQKNISDKLSVSANNTKNKGKYKRRFK